MKGPFRYQDIWYLEGLFYWKNMERIWSVIEKSWPETSVVNKQDELGKEIRAAVVLCPLYAPGDLTSAGLIKPPLKIDDSRVAGKVRAYRQSLTAMADFAQTTGRKLQLSVVLADRGVLFSGEPTKSDKRALDYHYQLYCQVWGDFSKRQGVGVTTSKYSEKNVCFPDFLDLRASLPVSKRSEGVSRESEVISYLNQYFGTTILETKKNRHVVERILGIRGINSTTEAFWLIAGYLAFDPQIPKLVGPEGIYVVAERLEPLFGISRFTEALNQLTRVQLKA